MLNERMNDLLVEIVLAMATVCVCGCGRLRLKVTEVCIYTCQKGEVKGTHDSQRLVPTWRESTPKSVTWIQ